MKKFRSKILIPITRFFYKDNRCHLIQEQNTVAFISDFWNNIKNNIEGQGMEMYVDVAAQSIYALAYILKFFDEIGIGAAKNAYNLLSYHDQFEICYIALGFPEIFKENKKLEDNPKYFEDFCKQIYPNLKIFHHIMTLLKIMLSIWVRKKKFKKLSSFVQEKRKKFL